MHDDHVLIENRLRRALSRVERAGYGARAPLEIAVWPVDGEPVPVAEALAAEFVPEVGDLRHDLEVLGELAAELDLGDPRRWQILRALSRSLDRLDTQDVAATATAARAELRDVLAVPARASAHRASAVGHAH